MVLEWTKGSWWGLILPAFFLLLQKGQFFRSEGSWWILLRRWIYRRIELRRSILTTSHLAAIPLSEQLVNNINFLIKYLLGFSKGNPCYFNLLESGICWEQTTIMASAAVGGMDSVLVLVIVGGEAKQIWRRLD
jgi:hypothetical protein